MTEVLQREPDLTLSELCQRFEARFGETISTSALDQGLKKHRIKQRWLEYWIKLTIIPSFLDGAGAADPAPFPD